MKRRKWDAKSKINEFEFEIEQLFQLLGICLEAGLPLLQCVDIMGNHFPQFNFKQVGISIKKGSTLSEALETSLENFPVWIVKTIERVESNEESLQEICFSIESTYKDLGSYNDELCRIMRIFLTLSKAGYSLLEAIDILRETCISDLDVQKDFQQIHNAVKNGNTFAEALRKSDNFNYERLTSLVALGEIGGILDTIIARVLLSPPREIKNDKLNPADYFRTLGLLITAGVPISDSLRILENEFSTTPYKEMITPWLLEMTGIQQVIRPGTKCLADWLERIYHVGLATGAIGTCCEHIADYIDRGLNPFE